MSELKYKTRGMAEPRGKDRVYFCCHPDEFSLFFESISDEILERQNCAVWYRDESDPYDESSHLADLSRMQLFIMPVTTRLLNTKNRALDVEFSFAVKNHIPILPLMQETGLDEIFNKKCGDLQYLDKFNRDATAISYDEKLTKFLSEVLIGDELAEKIRNAFDAYVFLSYRKKDRKYAQELMRLIHKNDFCRDIAIWYDEFLTPGENFNDSIKEALEKSGLFVLAVTPNLVNEENYIMTTEYPMARKEKKPILPAELVPTDRAVLREKYEDIPECTDAHNSAELSEALLESIKKMAIKENDSSPEHNFFIGLAYLGGIDVEVDHDRALMLISSAAEAGLKEALEKLISMYMSGDGVSRSFEKAIIWQKKLADVYGEAFRKEPSWEALDSWLSSYIGIGGKYSIMNRHADAIDTYLNLIKICDRIADLTANDRHIDRTRLRYKAQAYMYASTSCKNEGDIKRGVMFPKKALEILEPLYEEDFVFGSAWVKKDYANCLSFVGENARLANDLDTAYSYFKKANVIKKELYESSFRNITFAVDYSLGLITVAGIQLLRFETEKASDSYLKSMAILELAENENGTWETVPLYVENALSFSVVLRTGGDMEGLEKLLKDTLKKISDYKEATGVMLYYSAFRANIYLAQAYIMQKKFMDGRRMLAEAEKLNNEYNVICQRVIDVPLSCTCYSLLANIEFEEGDLVSARRYVKKAIVYADESLELGYNVHAADCAGVYSMYSSIELMEDNLEEGKKHLKKAITILEENSFSMDDARALPMFYSVYINYASVSFEDNDYQSAVEYGIKCIDAFGKYKKLAPGIVQSASIVPVYYLVAIAKMQIDKREAKRFLLESCEFFENKLSKERNIQNYDGVATMYLCLAGVSGVFERSKWNKKATAMIDHMEDIFGADFERTHIYSILNNQ